MPRSATSDDENALGLEQGIADAVQTGHFDCACLHVKATAHRIPNALGLLKNLLEHKVFVSTLFNAVQVQFKLVDHRIDREVRSNLAHGHPLSGDHCHFAIFQINDFLRAIQERRSIGTYKVFVVAQSEDQGRTQACHHHVARFVQRHHGNRIRPDNLVEGQSHRLV